MLHSVISLVQPSVAAIQEVVLRGTQSASERDLRERAVSYLRRQLRCPRISLRPQAPAAELSVSLWDWKNPAADALNFDMSTVRVRIVGT